MKSKSKKDKRGGTNPPQRGTENEKVCVLRFGLSVCASDLRADIFRACVGLQGNTDHHNSLRDCMAGVQDHDKYISQDGQSVSCETEFTLQKYHISKCGFYKFFNVSERHDLKGGETMAKRHNLKMFRVQRKMTQDEMASRLKYSRSQYALVERGERDGTFDFWENLQQTFVIPSADMWNLMRKDD